jgi:hypothetical protein
MSSDEEDYEVEKVLQERGGKYRVKWKGYPLSEATWELAENLFGCADLIAEFMAAQGSSSAQNMEPPNPRRNTRRRTSTEATPQR